MSVSSHPLLNVRAAARFAAGPRVSSIVRRVLRSQKKRENGDINVLFVDSKTIRRLNKQFLRENGDTDVIAFPYEKTSGDIYICWPVAVANARRFKEPLERELTRLVVHGTLHLLGYADWPKKERDKMWAQQEPLVEKIWRAKE